MIGNIVFIPIDPSDWDNKLETKYLEGCISGSISLSNIWTKADIIARWPNIKECNNFKEINQVYKSC